ncbi:MAG: hypothetical protein M0C28_33535 [Candidatus Moduliflexus flocculans]|nr:hypothetical protein [Candidatus Moduliflexus flocculans]
MRALAARRSVKECADAIGINNGLFRAYEEGTQSPLPAGTGDPRLLSGSAH